MILTLAGPGAGKTTDMINVINQKMSQLQSNRIMAIITYTNASVEDIKIKLARTMVLPPNVFVGTIHSFLLNFFIEPYANYLGYSAENITIVEKLSDVGVDWVDDWVKSKFVSLSKKQQEIKKKVIIQGRRNKVFEAAAHKGIYTYDSIIKFTRELINDPLVMKSVSNKIQFLFVDEYQDISNYGHQVIMQLEKMKSTEICVVGDPDQSIYKFRYGESQIGERAPLRANSPINQLMKMDESKCQIRKLLVNHRSSKEIVDFINEYSTLDNQTAEKGSICPVHFISSTVPEEIVEKLWKINQEFGCLKDCMIIAKLNRSLEQFSEALNKKAAIEENEIAVDTKALADYIVTLSGLKYRAFLEEYSMTPFELKRLVIAIKRLIIAGKVNNENFEEYLKKVSKIILGYEIEIRNSTYVDDKKKIQEYGFETNISDRDASKYNGVRCMTIHKSKGLEAECVLLVAATKNQFFKWIEMSQQDMANETDEDYRLGYVAFSRPKKVLVLACLEKIDEEELDSNIFKIV